MSNIKTWRSALGGDADTTTSSNAQHDQLNQSDTDEQHRKRHGIVFEPMPIIVKHLVHPYANAFGNRLVGQHTAHLFQAYFAATLSGFAVCGENLASISQFVARIRQGSSFKRSTMKLNERAPVRHTA